MKCSRCGDPLKEKPTCDSEEWLDIIDEEGKHLVIHYDCIEDTDRRA